MARVTLTKAGRWAACMGLVALLGALGTARPASAGDEEPPARGDEPTTSTDSDRAAQGSDDGNGPPELHVRRRGPPRLHSRPVSEAESSSESSDDLVSEDEPASSTAPTDEAPLDTLSLPTGADKSGVTSATLSIPKGSGTIEGMGESFSAQLSTGIATFSVPFALPAARGRAQPSLGLSYSSSSGHGLAGTGWDVGVPFIARQTDRGIPGYDDGTGWHENQDRFVFNGGQELVPICVVGEGLECAGALVAPSLVDPGSGLSEVAVTEEMPSWSSGWQYFRPRVEGSFLRFFWSPDHRTWRVQDKSGVTMELGVPRDGSDYTGSLEVNPDTPAQIYRWHLARQYDTHGSVDPTFIDPQPHNQVVYRYLQDGGIAYLSDIYDTPPADNPVGAPLGEYAHHTRLVYEERTDPTFSYRSGWRIDQRLRLARVDIASKEYAQGASSARRMVRRYHLAYQADRHVSLLSSVQVEGRCAGSEQDGPSETSTGELPESTGCGLLPPMQFAYSRVTPFTTSAAAGQEDLPGWEGFDERIQELEGSPPHSVDEQLADLFDVNSDSLPDVLVTAPGLYSDGHGLFLNGDGGPNRFGAARNIQIDGVLGANANTIKLSNSNLAPLDLDGDGTIDLLHMPKVKTYSVYAPEVRSGAWWWVGREVTTASNQDPKVDLGNDTPEIQVMDVNFDGLVDVVVSTGTEFQTFFSLGRLPGGDGQFGQGQWASASSSTLNNDPVSMCVPWSGSPVRFSDSDIKIADMNGDGITDIVRIRRGDIQYWPGRGNGFWGTASKDDCPAGEFGEDRHIQMSSSPQYSDIEGDSLRLDDVNGDGLADLVQVRMTDVDVWINEDGLGWTDRHVIEDTPASPSYANRVRLVDVNGSGTRDILWGDGNSYKYLDLEGGQRSWLLVGVDNGLGKSTSIEYSTSAYEMLAAESGTECTSPDAADPWSQKWCTKMPTVAHVVKRVTESDHLNLAGQGSRDVVTEYSYRDPVFEGRQREFRGFRRARARRVGDTNSPTDVTESVFLLGECRDENPSDTVDACAVSERWRDNPREALKGLPILTEKRSESGAYLSTEVTRYRLRHLYTGLDGRAVRHAVQVAQSGYLYDTGPFSETGSGSETLPVVETSSFAIDGSSEAVVPDDTSFAVPIRSGSAVRIDSASRTDGFGNREIAVAYGCTQNCASADGTVTGPDEPISTVTLAGRHSDDRTGWLWRTVQTWAAAGVVGEASIPENLRRKHQVTEYNVEGDPVRVTAALQGTVPLLRLHETGGATAPDPVDASVDHSSPDLVVSVTAYDMFGSPTRQQGPNGRCTDIGYDDAYAALPTSETIYVGGCDSPNPLVQAQAYDRGLGVVTVAIDMQGQPTQAEYDEFGRIVALTKPHPTLQGELSPLPSVVIEYFLPPDISPYYSAIHTLTQDAAALDQSEYLESWGFVDGFGRTLLTLGEADPDAGDAGEWVVSGQVDYDQKSAVRRKYLEYFWTGSPDTFPVESAPTGPYGSQRYDAFGRQLQTYDLDGTVTLQSRYHALSTDLFDAADLQPGPHQGTYASERKDGHGRTVVTTERAHHQGVIEARHVITEYLPTGEPRVITRRRGTDTSEVTRWMAYDTLGRMVLNVEPNTTEDYVPPTDDVYAILPTLHTWRYAYNDAGDLVGTSDARGCGVNFGYDGTGRLVAEDYSPCQSDHAPYSATLEVSYHYDQAPSAEPAGLGAVPEFWKGRLVATRDIGSDSWSSYDGRGRVVQVSTRVATPVTLDGVTGAPPATSPIESRYAAGQWFYRSFAFDAADREVAAMTGSLGDSLRGEPTSYFAGVDTDGDGEDDNTSVVTTSYTARGTIAEVNGSYGVLAKDIVRTADGLIKSITYGDAASTTTANQYDDRRRLKNVLTYRTPAAIWTPDGITYDPPPSYSDGTSNAETFQLLLQDEDFSYDVVGNPTEIRDWRLPAEWPAGAKPVTRKVQYDDLYRVARVDYQYSDGDDTWTSPHEPDLGEPGDPRRASPSPHMGFENRTRWQTFGYDWLGNNAETDDDAHGFYDRSLGTVAEKTGKPYQLDTASNAALGGDRVGSLTTEYDASGNLTELVVDRGTPCLPSGASCDQRFAYSWDEVGRLVRARRYDGGASDPSADLRYRYDAGDQRVLKTAAVEEAERHTVYVFESLELRRTTWLAGSSAYERTETTEVPYLFASGVRLGRVVYQPPADDVPEVTGGPADVPGPVGPALHVLLELGDHLGSTSVVLDKASGELVERSSFYAYGAAESDYRPGRWAGFREDYRFTGKEEDVEVGLVYFGKRFLNPLLGRWVGPDPLAVHVPIGADSNLYAYVRAAVLRAIDPLGLQEYGESGPGNIPEEAERDLPVNRVGGGGTIKTPEEIEAERQAAAPIALGAVCAGPQIAVCGGLAVPGDQPIPEGELPKANRELGKGVVGAMAGQGLGAVLRAGARLIRSRAVPKAAPGPGAGPEPSPTELAKQLDEAGQASVKAIKEAGGSAPTPAVKATQQTLRATNQPGQVTSRGSWRRATVDEAWSGAEPGPTGGRVCPTCKNEVKVPPRSGQPRDWDINHDPPWTKREFPPDVTRKEVLDNYQQGTWLECPSCNRAAGNRR